MKFISTAQAARYCQVSRGSMLRWIREGRLKAATTAGGHHRIQLSELTHLMNQLGLPMPEEMNSVKTHKILIVEDDMPIRRLIEKGLSLLEISVETRSAADGLQAGWHLSRFVPDLILLDLHLPKVDGYEICRLVKSEKVFKQTKVIAISTYSAEKKQRILEMGADAFLNKPFGLQQIGQAVREILLPESRKEGVIK